MQKLLLLTSVLLFLAASPAARGQGEDAGDGNDRPAAKALKLAAERNARMAEGKPERFRPNVIFYVVDDQRRDRMNFLPEGRDAAGHPRNATPVIDRLAGEGMILDNLHMPSPVCIPSRYNLLTGQYGSRATNAELRHRFAVHGYPPTGQNAHIVPGVTPTLPRMLQEAGYATGAVGKNHVVEVDGYDAGRFDDDINDPEVTTRLKRNGELVRDAFLASGFDSAERLYHNNLHPNGPAALLGHNLDWITEGALEFIEENRDGPFFLYFGNTLPHGPLDAGHTYLSDRRKTPLGMLDEPMTLLPSGEEIQRMLAEAGVDDPERGNATWIDSSVGAIQDKLEALGIAGDTVLIYVNDHGIEAGKTSLYQGGMLSHAFVSGGEPWVSGGRRTGALLSAVDLPATVLSWAGVDQVSIATPIDGIPAGPVFSGEVEAVRASVYGEIGYARSVRLGDWKYVALRPSPAVADMPMAEREAILQRWFERRDRQGQRREANLPEDPFPYILDIPGGVDNTWAPMRKHPHYFDAEQLYDLAADPDEQVNLAVSPDHADVLRTLRVELARHLATLPGAFGEFPGGAEAPAAE